MSKFFVIASCLLVLSSAIPFGMQTNLRSGSSADLKSSVELGPSSSGGGRKLIGMDCSNQSKPYTFYCQCTSDSDCWGFLVCDDRFKVCSQYSDRADARKLGTRAPAEKTSAQYHDFAESHKDDLATFNAAHSKEEIASVNKMIKEAISNGVEFEKIAQRVEALLAQTSYQQKMKAFVESHKDDLTTFNAAHSKKDLAAMDHMIKEAMSNGVEFEKIEQRIEALISADKQNTATVAVALGRRLRGANGKAPRKQLV